MIDTILFDLDGTLLPMDNDTFTRGYFKALAGKLAPFGYAPEQIVDAVWKGTAAMVRNDGTRRNIDAFWETFEPMMDGWKPEYRAAVDAFYCKEFHAARAFTQENPLAAPLVKELRRDGFSVALATNPIFPRHGVEARLGWIGLSTADFELVTAYENMHFCKPNPRYFAEICELLGKAPENCLMVGNNTVEDAEAAERAGLHALLVTDCLINEREKPLSNYEATCFCALPEKIRALCASK